MARSKTLILLSAVTLMGCARERPLAPTEMTDIVRFMFQHWEDDELMGEALANLDPWLRENVPSELAEDGYRLDPLARDDVSTVKHPDRPLTNLLGAAGGAISRFPLPDQAAHIVLPNQEWSNPSQYKEYSRQVKGDQGAFLAGEGLVRTVNHVETSSFGVTIPYELLKDYRWVYSEEGAEAIVARSWIEERACNDGGGNCLEQSFSIDVFARRGPDTVRFTASWSEVESSIKLGDDTLIAGLAMGLQNVFRSTEEFLEEQ